MKYLIMVMVVVIMMVSCTIPKNEDKVTVRVSVITLSGVNDTITVNTFRPINVRLHKGELEMWVQEGDKYWFSTVASKISTYKILK